MQKIAVYTDGSCHYNPGPGGWSCVLLSVFSTIEGQKTETPLLGIRRLSGYGGPKTTNNIMELTAILEGLFAIKKKEDREIVIYTDSMYSIGVLSQGWKARKNTDLIEKIRSKMREFPNLTFRHTKGHVGNAWNEECDRLANNAIKNKQGVSEYDLQPAPEKELF